MTDVAWVCVCRGLVSLRAGDAPNEARLRHDDPVPPECRAFVESLADELLAAAGNPDARRVWVDNGAPWPTP